MGITYDNKVRITKVFNEFYHYAKIDPCHYLFLEDLKLLRDIFAIMINDGVKIAEKWVQILNAVEISYNSWKNYCVPNKAIIEKLRTQLKKNGIQKIK